MQSMYRMWKSSCVVKSTFRYCSYKTIKRPTLSTSAVKSKFTVDSNAKNAETLSKQLAAKILATGPITVAEYMKEVLTNPVSGYYMHKDVFGEKGDFITSPEIGQIFGELVAIWCMAEWEKCGSPSPLQLIELGPGRGTLAQDVLRVFARFGLSNCISLHLVEISSYLCNMQARQLCCNSSETKKDDASAATHYHCGETISGIKVYWYHKIEDVPKAFSIYLAHEFFDALPIHKFQLDDDKWREVLIDIDRQKEHSFRYVISKAPTPMLNLFMNRQWHAQALENKRTHLEYSVETEKTIETMANSIESHGGFGLIMDYGHFGTKTDTFRAFRKHGLHDPLVEPGSADLTADVDFKNIKLIAEQNDKLITYGPIEQRDFLKRLGGDTRLEVLVNGAKAAEDIESLKTGYDMLTDPTKMGSRFKFFAMFPKVLQEHLKKFPVNGFQ